MAAGGDAPRRVLKTVVNEESAARPARRVTDSEPIRGPLAISIGAHAVVVAVVLFGPAAWISGLSGQVHAEPDVVMAISLGGPEGPGEGGQTALGGRPIQEILTLEEARRPQWIQPPAPAPPPMTVPVAGAGRRPEPETPVETVPEEARGRTPTRGPELLEGTAMADTGVEGIGIGLSGGGLGGSDGELDLANFCCPEYLSTMLQLIRRQWDANQQVPGVSVVRFTIQRDGAVDAVGVDRSSGYLALDMSAQRAILLTSQLPPLPGAFTEPSLTVRLTFEYRR